MICALAQRLGAKHPGFDMTPRELIDATLQRSGYGTLAEFEKNRWIDCQPDFATAHYLDGFAYAGRQIPAQAGLAERAVQPLAPQRAGRADAGFSRTTGP